MRMNSGNVTWGHDTSSITIHAPTLERWYFYIVEVTADTNLDVWVGDDAGTLTQVLDDEVSNARSTSYNALMVGTMNTPSYNLAGLDFDILYWAGFRNHTTDADDRTMLYNGGVPAVWPMVQWIENVSAVAPWYFHDFTGVQPLYENAAFGDMAEVGGSVSLTTNHSYWGTNKTIASATVLGMNPAAFWDFQEAAGNAPTDEVNGYQLAKGSTNWPKVIDGGGVFGNKAWLFTGAEYLKIDDDDAPAIDVSGEDAEVTVVAWYRDMQDDQASASLAQMWGEQMHRQYALFRSVNAAQRKGFVGHIASYTNEGGWSFNDWYNQHPTCQGLDPPYCYNYEYALDNYLANQWTIDGVMRVGAMTYDGMALRAYRDGTYRWNAYPDGTQGNCNTRGSRNPYISGDGGGISNVDSEFTVGARVTQTPGTYTEYLTGVVAGIAIFDRALTLRELATLSGLAEGSYPTVTIDTAGDQEITQGDALTLESTVDEDDHTNAVTTWTSSINGVLGTGDDLVLNTEALSAGTHTITCTSAEPAVACESTSTSEVGVPSAGVLDVQTISLTVQAGSGSFGGVSGLHYRGDQTSAAGSHGLHYRGDD